MLFLKNPMINGGGASGGQVELEMDFQPSHTGQNRLLHESTSITLGLCEGFQLRGQRLIFVARGCRDARLSKQFPFV